MLKKVNWSVLWRPRRPLKINTKKRWPIHYRGLECESRKSGDIWSNRQAWPWSTKWSRTKSNGSLSRECTGHGKQALSTTQETTLPMDITKWSILKSDWLHFCSQIWRSCIQSAKTRPGADCGSDHQFLITKFRFKLRKVGKTNRQVMYELN